MPTDEVVIQLRRSLLIAVIFAIIALLAIVSWFIFYRVPIDEIGPSFEEPNINKTEQIIVIPPPMVVSIRANNDSVCNDYKIEEAKLYCKFSVHANMNDSNYCTKNYNRTAVFERTLPQTMEKIKIISRDYCWLRMTEVLQVDYCKKIYDSSAKGLCYYNLSGGKNV